MHTQYNQYHESSRDTKSSVIGAMMLILCGFLSGVFLTLITTTAKAAEFTEEESSCTVISTIADADMTPMIGTLSMNCMMHSSEIYDVYGAIQPESLFTPYLSSLSSLVSENTLLSLRLQKAIDDSISAAEEIEVVEPEPEPLPINTSTFTAPSNLSVDQLNEMINRTLAKYTDKSGSSIFVNSGQYLYDAAHKYNVNELFILAVGCYEGAWGTSPAAKNKHNSYGIMASGNRQRSYSSVEEGIHAFCKLAREFYFDCGRTDTYSFASKYCPPTPRSWTGGVNDIFHKYASCIS